MRRLCSVSIDVDPIPCYYRIHGLGPAPAALRNTVLRRGLPRFGELLAARGIRATFFVVAEDLDVGAVGPDARGNRAVLRELVAAGHELASHSYSHPYEMARLARARVADEIGRAHGLIGDVAGDAVVGFRAPGYDLSAAMLDELCARGYRYDSSIFPAPGYYAAKLAVLAALRATGCESGAVLTDPRALAAPADPYRPRLGAPWRRGSAPLVELPVAVTPWARTPAIGTNLLLAPARLRSHWIGAMARRPHFNFELHGIDLCDADLDGIPGALVARQPDLRAPLAKKRDALEACLDAISARFAFAPLREAADEAERALGVH